MSLAFGKSLGASRRALSGLSGVRDQYPIPYQMQARPVPPTPRPVYNGPLGSHGPSGMVSRLQPGDGANNVVGRATGIAIRNRRSNLPQRAAYSGLYGKTSDQEWAEMGLGPGGGSPVDTSSKKFGISDSTVNRALDIVSGFLSGKNQTVPDQQVYAPPPPPSTTPSWAMPALAVGALGLVGAIVYSVVR
jgi:hypothetical protein